MQPASVFYCLRSVISVVLTHITYFESLASSDPLGDGLTPSEGRIITMNMHTLM